jgi:hypothetical protein
MSGWIAADTLDQDGVVEAGQTSAIDSERDRSELTPA